MNNPKLGTRVAWKKLNGERREGILVCIEGDWLNPQEHDRWLREKEPKTGACIARDLDPLAAGLYHGKDRPDLFDSVE